MGNLFLFLHTHITFSFWNCKNNAIASTGFYTILHGGNVHKIIAASWSDSRLLNYPSRTCYTIYHRIYDYVFAFYGVRGHCSVEGKEIVSGIEYRVSGSPENI